MGASIIDFLTRVIPWPDNDQAAGYCNLHWTHPTSPGMRGRPYKNPHEMLSMAQWGAGKPSQMKDIYFCLSSQKAPGKVINNKPTALRNQRNVHRLKALWIDIDVKPDKGYLNTEDAVRSLGEVCRASKLPPPSSIVLSGGGLHVYWISKTPLTQEEWRPYAEGLEALTKTHGLKRDPGLTTDSARVLRFPGTFNYKTSPPRPVKLVALGNDYDFEKDLGHIKVVNAVTTAVTKQPDFDLSAFPIIPVPHGSIESLAEGISVHDDTPLPWVDLLKYCPHFRETYITHGANNEQGLWMLDILASTFLEDAREIAHTLSKGYKSYTKEETDKMFDRKSAERSSQGLGWPSCGAFENAGCSSCATCVYKGKIRSPLNLAAKAVKAPPPVVNQTPADKAMCLPDDCFVDPDDGLIYKRVQKQLGNGTTHDTVAKLFQTKIADPWMQNGPAALNVVATIDVGRTYRLSLPETEFATDNRLFVMLRQKGIKPNVPEERYLRDFMTTWTQKMDDAFKRVDSGPYGWVMEGGEPVGFSYGGWTFRKDGKDHRTGVADPILQESFTPAGKPEVWQERVKFITDQHRYDLEVLVAMAFGAPLMRVPAQYNGILHSYSESGYGKSTAIATGAAVWGNPLKTKNVPNATEKSVLNKIGALCNLPAYWDELSDEEAIKKVAAAVKSLTEGVEGSRLTSQVVQREVGTWQTMLGTGANLSLWSHLMGSVTDARLRRVFEIEVKAATVPSKFSFSEVAEATVKMNYNYGWAGLEFAKYLGRNPEDAEAKTKHLQKLFEDIVKPREPERFWTAVCVTCLAGAFLANQVLKTEFHINEMFRYLISVFMWHRTEIQHNFAVGGSDANTGDALTYFLKDSVENAIWIRGASLGNRGRKAITLDVLKCPQRDKAIHVQWDIDGRMLRISRTRFEEVMKQSKYDYGLAVRGIKKHYGGKMGARINLASGTTLTSNAGREPVIQIPVQPNTELWEMLWSPVPIPERPNPSASTETVQIPTELLGQTTGSQP